MKTDIPENVLLTRARDFVKDALKRLHPTHDYELIHKGNTLLDALGDVPPPVIEFSQIHNAVEAAEPYAPSTDGRNVLPQGDR